MNLDGSENKKMNDVLAFNLIFHDGFLYYIDRENLKLGKISTNSNEIEIINQDEYYNFNINNNQLVCSDLSSFVILDTNGKLINRIEIEGGLRDTSINLVDNYVFFRRFGGNEIKMIDLETFDIVTVIDEE
ncbi:DUF5050 domain-containing protein [Lacrimispora brassicae]